MCCKTSSLVNLAKIAIVLIVFCYAESSEGGSMRGQTAINKKKISACLNYGHSCWGAHGKRTGQIREDAPSLEGPMDIRWFLSRLHGGYKGMEPAEVAKGERQYLRNNHDLGELLRSISDENESLGPADQDDSGLWRNTQVFRFLKHPTFEEAAHN